MSLLGERIRKIRGKVSQADFGATLGVDRTTVGSWEVGRHEPSLELLIKIADMGGVSLDWLSGRFSSHSHEEEKLFRDPNWQNLILFSEQNNITPEKAGILLKAALYMHR